jgi:phosphomannomutase
MDTSIFKTYDIRGIYGKNLDADTARRVARAFGKIIKKGIVIIGYDARIGSPILFSALKNELKKNGKYKVWSIGMVTTPMFYFAVNKYKAAGGIMVTASHNPKEWNGFKVVGKGARMIGGKEVGAIVMCEHKKIQKREVLKKQSSVPQKNILPQYIRFLKKHTHIKEPLRVVFDCGNGVAGLVLKKLVPQLKNVVPYFLFANPDGNFPGRDPNPLSLNALFPLICEVKKRNADIGMAFDADADRVFFVDNKGRIIPSYVIVSLFGGVFDGPFVGEILVYHALKSIGFQKKIYKTKVGTYFIKEKMIREKAVVAGEYSGHYYFKDFFFADSGIVTAVNVLSALSSRSQSLGDFFDALPTLFITLLNVHSKNIRKDMKRVEAEFKKKTKKIDPTDGKTFLFDTAWVNMRPSNTEPLLRFVIAAKTKKELDVLTRTIKSRTL